MPYILIHMKVCLHLWLPSSKVSFEEYRFKLYNCFFLVLNWLSIIKGIFRTLNRYIQCEREWGYVGITVTDFKSETPEFGAEKGKANKGDGWLLPLKPWTPQKVWAKHFLIFNILKTFFLVDNFWSPSWICYNIASILGSGFLAPRHMESQLPTQGLNPHPLSGGGGGERGKVLNTGQMEESQERIFKGKVGRGIGQVSVFL